MFTDASARRRSVRLFTTATLSAGFIATTLGVLSTLWKLSCTGGDLVEGGVTSLGLRAYGSRLCYSDLLVLWQYRGLADHAAPYVGTYASDGQITGGVIEYPVLGGFFLWLTGLPADIDTTFILVSGVTLAVVAGIIAVILSAISGRRALLWAASPALLVYTAYNIDVLPALTVVLAIAVLVWPSSLGRRNRALIAAAVLGVGGAIKLYPLIIVLPVALWLAVSVAPDRRWVVKWGHLASVLATGAGAYLLMNVPFALASPSGWLASFQFQSARRVDDNSMALWWWIPHLFGVDLADKTALLTALAGLATAAAFVAIVVVGFARTRREGTFPWLQVSGALLAAFMVLGKVNSPQYTLWILPFFVVLAVRVRWVLVYFVVDLAIVFAYFRPFLYAGDGIPTPPGLPVLLALGIVVRAVLLGYFCLAFLRSSPAITFREVDTSAQARGAQSWTS